MHLIMVAINTGTYTISVNRWANRESRMQGWLSLALVSGVSCEVWGIGQAGWADHGRSCSIKCKQSRPWPCELWTRGTSSAWVISSGVSSQWSVPSSSSRFRTIQKIEIKLILLQFLFINACVHCDTQSWFLPRPPKMKLFLSVSSQHAAVCSQGCSDNLNTSRAEKISSLLIALDTGQSEAWIYGLDQ